MSKKIYITKYGFVHYIAIYSKCNFHAVIYTDETITRSDVRSTICKHILETGHSVTIEGGNATKYSIAP